MAARKKASPRLDRVAAHNRQMWEKLAAEGHPYTQPEGTPPASAAARRRFLDPAGRLKGVRIKGARVLALAAGGGWHAPLFSALGAETVLLDISPRQLATARRCARELGARVRTVEGTMTDLSAFDDASFDIVWHMHSLVFVRDAAQVFREVGRVLAPGGTYVTSTMHPTTLRLYRTWSGGGWSPLVPYGSDEPMPSRKGIDDVWHYIGGEVVAPTIEYGHRIETIVNGIAAAGMVVDGLWEYSPDPPDPNDPPGSDGHLESVFPSYVEVRARRLPRA